MMEQYNNDVKLMKEEICLQVHSLFRNNSRLGNYDEFPINIIYRVLAVYDIYAYLN